MLQLIEIGLVFKNVSDNDCRIIVLKDLEKQRSCDYHLVKNNQPYLWKTIEKSEKSNNRETSINGSIEEYNGFEIVVFEGEDPATAFERQKSGLKENKVLSYKEAKDKAEKSQGYKTEKENDGAMVPGWIPLDSDVKKIKFRYYHSPHQYATKKTPFFQWTDWFGISK